MFLDRVIETAQTNLATPTVFAPKKDGSPRFAVDFRKLNFVTKRGVYQITRENELLNSLGAAAVFSTLDTNGEYWQSKIEKENRDDTAFTSHHVLSRFVQTSLDYGLLRARSKKR